MKECVNVKFHGLNLELWCEVDADPGEEASYDCPGSAGWCSATKVWHDGSEIEPSEELQAAIDEALVEMYNARELDEGAP